MAPTHRALPELRLVLPMLVSSMVGLTALLLIGCDETEATDGGSDAAMECVAPAPLAEGDATGAAAPLSAEAGQARAGRLAASDVPDDPRGLSTVAAGDFVLANDRIAVVIEDVGDSDGFDPWGGKPVAIGLVEAGALSGLSNFNESIPMMGRYIPDVVSVSVLADGLDGGPAVVRAIGPLVPIPAFDVLFAELIAQDIEGVEVAVDYSLAPDSDHVDVDYTFRVAGPMSVRIRQPLHFFFQATRMPIYRPGAGFDSVPGELPWVAFVGEGATSFAVRSLQGPLQPVIELSGGSIFSARSIPVLGCAVSTVPFSRMYVGGPGIDGLLTIVDADDGVVLREITGVARDAGGTPISALRVVAEAPDGRLTRTRTDGDGTYRLRVPMGAVTVSAWRASTGLVGPIDVDAGASGADLTLPPIATLEVRATDAASGGELPARIQVLADDPPMPPARFGEPEPAAGRLHVAWPIDGSADLEVPPGPHRVVVSRGYEYGLFISDVTVVAGEVLRVDAPLEHLAPTPGVVCGDFHLHTQRSIDSPDDGRLKLAAAIAEGVELPVRTDHEWVADFEPEISAMAITDWAFSFAGVEMTTFTWGHFGIFPLDVDPARANGGAIRSAYRTTPEVFADVRATSGAAGAPTIVINHPRTFGGIMNEGAYFNAVGYDATTGAVERPELWDDGFQLIEVFNGSDFDANRDGSVADWFSFLNAGRRVFALGASDSHTVRSTPIGYPRTCMQLGVDDAPAVRALGASAVRDALLAGQAVISGGIFIDAVARGGVGVGGDVTGAVDRETLSVVVQAPPWIDVDHLRVFVDGALVETIPIDDSTTDPLDLSIRLRGDIMVSVAAAGSWVVLVAAGDAPLEPVHRGQLPFGVTNPIFFVR